MFMDHKVFIFLFSQNVIYELFIYEITFLFWNVNFYLFW